MQSFRTSVLQGREHVRMRAMVTSRFGINRPGMIGGANRPPVVFTSIFSCSEEPVFLYDIAILRSLRLSNNRP